MRHFFSNSKQFYFKAIFLALLATLVLYACQPSAENPDREEWIYLFDGSDMESWTPKFAGFDLGVNYKDRFVFKDSLLSVRYVEK